MSSQPVNPLNQSVPIVNPNGTPTWEFMRKWEQQFQTNGTIPSAADPTSEVSSDAVDGTATTFMRSDAAPKLKDTGVTPGEYGDATHYPLITVDAQGRITEISTEPAASALTLTDGTHTVTGVEQITVTGGVVGGATPNATLTISASGGVTSLGYPPPFNPTAGTTLAANFFFGRTIVASEALSVSNIIVPFQTSQPTAKLQPCIYAVSISGGTFGALLASGPVVTGAVKGVQALPLSAPYSVAKGDIIMFGFIVDTAVPFVCATAASEAVQFMAATTGSPPNPASGVTDTARQWGTFWLSA